MAGHRPAESPLPYLGLAVDYRHQYTLAHRLILRMDAHGAPQVSVQGVDRGRFEFTDHAQALGCRRRLGAVRLSLFPGDLLQIDLHVQVVDRLLVDEQIDAQGLDQVIRLDAHRRAHADRLLRLDVYADVAPLPVVVLQGLLQLLSQRDPGALQVGTEIPDQLLLVRSRREPLLFRAMGHETGAEGRLQAHVHIGLGEPRRAQAALADILRHQPAETHGHGHRLDVVQIDIDRHVQSLVHRAELVAHAEIHGQRVEAHRLEFQRVEIEGLAGIRRSTMQQVLRLHTSYKRLVHRVVQGHVHRLHRDAQLLGDTLPVPLEPLIRFDEKPGVVRRQAHPIDPYRLLQPLRQYLYPDHRGCPLELGVYALVGDRRLSRRLRHEVVHGELDPQVHQPLDHQGRGQQQDEDDEGNPVFTTHACLPVECL